MAKHKKIAKGRKLSKAKKLEKKQTLAYDVFLQIPTQR